MFGTVQAGLAFYEHAFGVPYPFGKYDQIFVPEYNWGAMENVGAVTFNESYLFRARVSDARREQRAIVVLHELSHMWFGNSVTMQWWNDLWLNESFATWASTLATVAGHRVHGRVGDVRERREDARRRAGPAAVDASDRRRDPRPRRRRGELRRDHLRQGRLGAEAARRVGRTRGVPARASARTSPRTRAATRRCATCSTSSSARADASSTRWSELWLETAGVNTLRAVVETDAAGTITAARVEQSAAPSHPTLRPHRLAHRLLRERRRRRRSCAPIAWSSTSTARRPTCPELVGLPRPDLLLVNDDDLTYAKVRLDERSFDTAVSAARRARRSRGPRGRARVGMGRRARRRAARTRLRAPRARQRRPRDPVRRPRARPRPARARRRPLPRRRSPRAAGLRDRRRRVGARRARRDGLRRAAAVREGVHAARRDAGARRRARQPARRVDQAARPGCRPRPALGARDRPIGPRRGIRRGDRRRARGSTTPRRDASSPRPRAPHAPTRR